MKTLEITKIKNFEGCYTISEVERLHNGHWFDTNTMRYFKCRIDRNRYLSKNRMFISSEKYQDESRKYTVRYVAYDGSIETLGEFNVLSKYYAEKLMKNTPVESCIMLDLIRCAFNTRKYYKNVKSYINNHSDTWWYIKVNELCNDWLIRFTETEILNN